MNLGYASDVKKVRNGTKKEIPEHGFYYRTRNPYLLQQKIATRRKEIRY